jgi:hypothetical protein
MAERAISHVGIPLGMRAIITIGEVNGIIESQNTNGEFGSFITIVVVINARIIGMVIGVVSCCASCAVSTLAPTAAYIAA